MVQAGFILDILETKVPQKDKVCSWLGKTDKNAKDSAQTIYLRTEASRLFKCTDANLNSLIKSQAQGVLVDVERHVQFDDYYYSHLLNSNAKQYQLTFSDKLSNDIKAKIKMEYLDKFKEDSLKFGDENGLTVGSLHAL